MKKRSLYLSQALLATMIICSSVGIAQEETGIVEAQPIFARITIDGDFSDWDGVPPAYIDAIGDSGGSEFDFAAAYFANDHDYLYIRIEFAEPVSFGEIGWRVNIAFDTDLLQETGFGFAGLLGSEFFVQSGAIFDQRSGERFVDVFEQTPENNWGAFASAATAPFDTTTNVEISIRRDLTFSNDEDGNPGLINPDDSPLFPYEDFLALFEAEDSNFAAVEFMPNPPPGGGYTGIIYTFADGPTSVRYWPIFD